MAKDLNSGAERLTGRILEDARAEASKTAREAEAQAGAIKARAEAEAARIAEEYEDKARKAAGDILERSRTNAELDARKQALTAKRQVLDAAFEAALKGMRAMPEEKRDGFFKGLILQAAYGGETVYPAAEDAGRAQRLLPEINAALEAAGKAPLTLGAERQDIGGGCLIAGCGYEMNCSFEALLHDFREKEEGGVAKLLFG